MKAIFFFSASILLFSTQSLAQTLTEVHTCLTGIDLERESPSGAYTSILLSGNKLGGSLLSMTGKGAEVVQGTFYEKDQTLSFSFKPAGHQSHVTQSFYIQSDNKIVWKWAEFGNKTELSSARQVTGKEALTLAGGSLLSQAQELSKGIDSQLVNLEAYVKRPLSSKAEDSQSKVKELIQQEEQRLTKYLGRLKSCNQMPDRNIKRAAEIERARLEKFQAKLQEISRGSTEPPPSVKPATTESAQ